MTSALTTAPAAGAAGASRDCDLVAAAEAAGASRDVTSTSTTEVEAVTSGTVTSQKRRARRGRPGPPSQECWRPHLAERIWTRQARD